MAFTRRLRIALWTVALTGPPLLYLRSYIRRLEQKYPPLPPDLFTTLACRTPRQEGQRTPYVDVYGARVPISSLLASDKRSGRHTAPITSHNEPSLEELWSRSFISSRAMRLEGALVKGGPLLPDDVAENGFRLGQSLLGGILHVLRTPSAGSPLLAEWHMPSHVTGFFERIAAWGYPWRLMDGGRHEWSVQQTDDGEVEVRFAAAHDYKVVQEEGSAGKIIPRWVLRLHRAYARFLLDEVVEQLRAQAIEKET
ncbi:hypothetical protein NM688_g2746 [Phlebia brevispora]|uniref:Uncharacterized protein n=1 Tax=Phlebia brevispora TaxID=194682 RepID=A0ACC1T7V0_9APHY|nr:hypothetical protein NM688_g2746 [Phlebia brevispora]